MANLQQAKSQIAEARQKLAEQREKISERKELIETQREKLTKAREKIPNLKTQKSLRQQVRGLEGRKKIREVEKVKKRLSSEQERLKESGKELKGYEKELEDFEKENIMPVEKQIGYYERRQSAIKRAKKLYSRKISPYWIDDSLTKKYLKDLYEQRRLQQKAFSKQVSQLQKQYPNEKLIINWDKLKIKGIESGALGQSIEIKNYNKTIGDIKTQSLEPIKIENISVPNKIKERTKFGNFLEALGNVPFYQDRLRDIPKKYSPLDIPIAIPEFDRTNNGKLTAKPSTIGKQVESFGEFSKMLGEESAKGYRQAFQTFDIPEQKIKFDKEGKSRIGLTGAGVFVRGVEAVPEISSYAVPVYGELAIGKELIKDEKVESKRLASERYKNYIGDLSKKEYVEQVAPQIEEKLRKNKLLMGGAFVGGGLIVRGASKGGSYLFGKVVRETPKGFKVTTRASEFFGKRVRVGKGNIEVKPSQKGKYFEFEKLEKPVKDIDVVENIGVDFGKKTIYPEQQIAQRGAEGRMTIVKKVTSSGKENVLYEGVPYFQRKEYSKEFEYLKNLFGERQARQTLRLVSPKVQKQFLEGQVNIVKDFAKANFISKIRKPKIVLNERIGLKTRGGRTDIKTMPSLRFGKEKQFLEVGVGVEGQIGKNVINIKALDVSSRVGRVKKLTPIVINGKEIQRIQSGTIDVPIKDVNLRTGRTLLVKREAPKTENLGFRGGGRKSSQEYLDSLYSQELKVVPKVDTKPIKRIETSTQIPEVKETPLMVGGTGLKEVPYAGTGLYERTESVSIQTIKPTKIDSIKSNVLQDFSQKGVSIIPLFKNKTELKKTPFQKTKVKTIQEIKPMEETKSKIEVKLGQLSKTKQRTILKTKQTTSTEAKSPLKPRERITPKPSIKPKLPLLKRLKERIRKEQDFFTAFVKKKGKEIEIGKAKTKEEAELLLKSKLVKTLRASGGIKFGELKLKSKEINLGLGFRPSKKDPFSIVEKKSKRLRRGGTGQQIQFFRKTNGRNKNLLKI